MHMQNFNFFKEAITFLTSIEVTSVKTILLFTLLT